MSIVRVVRYGLVCDRCGANSLTDEDDQYAYPVDDVAKVREHAEDLGWSVGAIDLCVTCIEDDTGGSRRQRQPSWRAVLEPTDSDGPLCAVQWERRPL